MSSDYRLKAINNTLRQRRREPTEQGDSHLDEDAVPVEEGVTYRVSGITPGDHYARSNQRQYELALDESEAEAGAEAADSEVRLRNIITM